MGWIILGAVLGLIALILLIPVRVCLTYRTEPKLTVWVAFVPIRLLPAPERAAAPPQKKKEKPEKPGESGKKQNLLQEIRQTDGISGVVSFLKQAIAIALRLVGRVTLRLVIERLDLRFSAAAGDSAETAILYGKACAAVYPAVTLLSGALHSERIRVTVAPDFLADSVSVDCRLRIRLRLIWPVAYGVQALVRFLRLMIRQKRRSAAASVK